MIIEFEGQTKAAKAKGLGRQKRFYYLFFIGTRDDCQGKGKGPCFTGAHLNRM